MISACRLPSKDSRKMEKLAHGLPISSNSEVAKIELTSVPVTIINLGQHFFKMQLFERLEADQKHGETRVSLL